ncbi:MAG: hypothetical protein LBL62_12450 [Planctomycetaceae bacterium]|jgi:hypothetical protein|nr:hypothetical protein [Planctomycetaceae bacterium]
MSRTVWHPAFFGAIRLELSDYWDVLEFEAESQLTSEPLKIDVLIIKKIRHVDIQKNIGKIFRDRNVIEYKSPSDSVSIDDYHKTQSYSRFYAAFNHVDIDDMSVTIVTTKHPNKLLKYLNNRFCVNSDQNGIYIVTQDTSPTQIVVLNELAKDQNHWITSLTKKLTVDRLKRVVKEVLPYKNDAIVAAYLDVVIGANMKNFKEISTMKTLTQHLKDMGYIDKWIAQGYAKGYAEGYAEGRAEGKAKGLAEEQAKWKANQIEKARKFKNLGVDCEIISEGLGLPLKKVKELK